MEQQLSNKEVGGVMKTLAALMELHGQNDFRVKSYSNAAFQIGRITESVIDMDLQTLESTRGIGKSVAGKIIELRATGKIRTLQELLDITPEGVVEMMLIKGLGAKKIAVIWKELGVETPGELLYACYENRLAKLKGFGEKTQNSVIQSIEYYQANMGKFHFAVALGEAIMVEKGWPVDQRWERSGALRREENIVEVLEWVTTAPISSFSAGVEWTESDGSYTAVSPNGIPMRLIPLDAADFAMGWWQQTGSVEHVEKVMGKIGKETSFSTEADIYQAAGLPFIPPFLREDLAEWDLAEKGELDSLIRLEDINGVVHNHSTWSDGRNSIREMAEACMALGYTYLVISDHSKTAVYAGGLEIERVHQQHLEIDQLNKELAPFRIFKSIESDILNDGSLDYPDEVLTSFDLVIASVHQNLRMEEEKATARLLTAIENPYTAILGHMTGRLLLSRPGYPLDHRRIIDACAANHVAIELNANPYRLDMDYSWIPYARKKAVLIPINPDAHSTTGIQDIFFGVSSARKGGLTKQGCLNTYSLPEFEKWLSDRKAARGIA